IDVEVVSIPTVFDGQIATQMIMRDVTNQRTTLAALRREEEQLRLLVEASSAVLGSLDLAEVLSRILNLARHHIAADAYAVWRYQGATKTWQAVASAGLSEAYRDASIDAEKHSTVVPDHPL